MQKRRSDLEIFRDILIGALEGTRKTRIVHRTNMNAKSFSGYFKTLIRLELIEQDQDSKLFKTTEMGRAFIRKLDEVERMIGKERRKDTYQLNNYHFDI